MEIRCGKSALNLGVVVLCLTVFTAHISTAAEFLDFSVNHATQQITFYFINTFWGKDLRSTDFYKLSVDCYHAKRFVAGREVQFAMISINNQYEEDFVLALFDRYRRVEAGTRFVPQIVLGARDGGRWRDGSSATFLRFKFPSFKTTEMNDCVYLNFSMASLSRTSSLQRNYLIRPCKTSDDFEYGTAGVTICKAVVNNTWTTSSQATSSFATTVVTATSTAAGRIPTAVSQTSATMARGVTANPVRASTGGSQTPLNTFTSTGMAATAATSTGSVGSIRMTQTVRSTQTTGIPPYSAFKHEKTRKMNYVPYVVGYTVFGFMVVTQWMFIFHHFSVHHRARKDELPTTVDADVPNVKSPPESETLGQKPRSSAFGKERKANAMKRKWNMQYARENDALSSAAGVQSGTELDVAAAELQTDSRTVTETDYKSVPEGDATMSVMDPEEPTATEISTGTTLMSKRARMSATQSSR